MALRPNSPSRQFIPSIYVFEAKARECFVLSAVRLFHPTYAQRLHGGGHSPSAGPTSTSTDLVATTSIYLQFSSSLHLYYGIREPLHCGCAILLIAVTQHRKALIWKLCIGIVSMYLFACLTMAICSPTQTGAITCYTRPAQCRLACFPETTLTRGTTPQQSFHGGMNIDSWITSAREEATFCNLNQDIVQHTLPRVAALIQTEATDPTCRAQILPPGECSSAKLEMIYTLVSKLEDNQSVSSHVGKLEDYFQKEPSQESSISWTRTTAWSTLCATLCGCRDTTYAVSLMMCLL